MAGKKTTEMEPVGPPDEVMGPEGGEGACPVREPEANPVALINVDRLERCKMNREVKKDGAFKALQESIAAHGMINPIQVVPAYPLGDTECAEEDRYMIFAGERRYRAAREIGWESVPCIVRGDLSIDEAVELLLVDNMERQDLTPLEAADGVHELQRKGRTYEEIADKLNRSVSWVARMVRVGRLIPEFKDMIRTDERFSGWGAKHLELIARESETTQGFMYSRYKNMQHYEYLPKTLDDLRGEVERHQCYLKDAIWKMDEEIQGDKRIHNLSNGKLPKCSECALRAGNNPMLWDADELDESDRCLRRECFLEKWERTAKLKWQKLTADHGNAVVIWGGGTGDQETRIQKITDAKKIYLTWDGAFDKVKKSTAGAFPGMVFKNWEVSIEWYVKRKKDAGKRGNGEAGKKTKEEKAKEKQEREERNKLQEKIAGHIDAIQNAIDESGEADAQRVFEIIGLGVSKVLAAAAVYIGLWVRQADREDIEKEYYREYKKILDVLEKDTGNNCGHIMVAKNLSPVVIQRMGTVMYHSEKNELEGILEILESREMGNQ